MEKNRWHNITTFLKTPEFLLALGLINLILVLGVITGIHKMMRFGHDTMMMQGGREMMMNGDMMNRNGGRMKGNYRTRMMNSDNVDQDVSNLPYRDDGRQAESTPATGAATTGTAK